MGVPASKSANREPGTGAADLCPSARNTYEAQARAKPRAGVKGIALLVYPIGGTLPQCDPFGIP